MTVTHREAIVVDVDHAHTAVQRVQAMSLILWIESLCSRSVKKSNFDQKPEGVPEELLTNAGTLGAMMKAYAPGASNPSVTSKIIRRLFVTNLPKDYQDIVSLVYSSNYLEIEGFPHRYN